MESEATLTKIGPLLMRPGSMHVDCVVTLDVEVRVVVMVVVLVLAIVRVVPR